MADAIRKLHRSVDDRMIGGVCGGVGKFFGIDSTVIRLLFVLSIFLGGGGIFVYIVALFIVPLEEEEPKKT
jgi:phage shock protein PspC (stress-responsive transcriptional regulator)